MEPIITAEDLAESGFKNHETAVKNFESIAARLGDDFEGFRKLTLLYARHSFDPDEGMNNFERFIESACETSHFPPAIKRILGSNALFYNLFIFFSGSPYLSKLMVSQPEMIEWLTSFPLEEIRLKNEMMKDAARMVARGKNKAERFGALRCFRNREIVRIGLRDLCRLADFVETVENLTDLADVVMQQAYEICHAELASKFGIPMETNSDGEQVESTFAVVGLGKLGGKELNFSSDIDVIYVYSSSDGETLGVKNFSTGQIENKIPNHEFFCRLAKDMSSNIGDVGKDGMLYRIDLRLRPEGRSGQPAMSLRRYEVYYESWGETWERQMLVKARIIAGDPHVGKRWQEIIRPFIYRKNLDYNAIAEIRAVKERINQSLIDKNKHENNVKLGYGGIREIEFIVQVFQLIYAGKFPWLKERNTMRAIHRIAEKDFITIDEYSQLSRAYIFLRELENRIQIANGFQIYTIPKASVEQDVLARNMGFHYAKNPVKEMMEAYGKHTKNVRKVYDSLFYDEKETSEEFELWDFGEAFYDEQLEHLAELGFTDPEGMYHILQTIYEGGSSGQAHQTAHSKFLFRKLVPVMLNIIKKFPAQNITLSRLDMFLQNFVNKESVYNYLLENKPITESLLLLFSRSYYFAKTILSNVELFYDVHYIEDIHSALEDHLESFSESYNLSEGRKFKRVLELLCGLKCLRDGNYDPAAELTSYADFFLQKVYEDCRSELAERYGEPMKENGRKALFGIYGLGKLGARELDFASDLDLIFVYDENGQTDGTESISNHEFFVKLQNIIVESLTATGKSGIAYKVDLRLRPFGKIGKPVDSFEVYEKYFREQGEIWEKLAYTKLRYSAGDVAIDESFRRIVDRFIYPERGKEPEDIKKIVEQILSMRLRMERERAKEKPDVKDVKLGYGGVVDIDFIIQFLLLRHGGKENEVRSAKPMGALTLFAERGYIDEHDKNLLHKAYAFYRRLVREVRIESDHDGTKFNFKKNFNADLANRMGFENVDDLVAFYLETTKSVRETMKKIIAV